MNSRQLIVIGIVVLAIVATAGAYYVLNDSPADEVKAGRKCLDMSGNEVTMPEEVESIAVIGVGSLRTVSHLGLADKICSSDQLSKGATYGSNTYMYAYDEFFNNQDVIDHSGARQAVNLESVLKCNKGEKPDVLLIVDDVVKNNQSTVDAIKKAGVVVFEIKSVQELMGDDFKIAENYKLQLTRLGVAFGVEDRANEIIDGVNAILDEIRGMRDSSIGSVYVGGLTIHKLRGLSITSPDYTPFKLIDANNIVSSGSSAVDAGGSAAGVSIKTEDLVQIIDDSGTFKVFVDPAAWRLQKGLCTGDDLISTALCNKGITQGTVLTPFHSYGMEYDNILVNCYLVAGELLGMDADTVRQKIDAVYQLYYGNAAVNSKGVKLYDEMGAWYLEQSWCEFGKKVTFNVGSITTTNGTVLSPS